MSVPPDGRSPPVGDPPGASEPQTDAGEDADVHAFLIADFRGYTTFTQERGDEDAARLAGRFAEVARTVVADYRGRVIELRGDEALAVFGSPRSAIRAAVALQQRFLEETIADPSLPLTVGIGLDAGEAVPVDGGYRGGALNVAGRLCSLARAGEILASREIVHLARRVDGVRFTERGQVRLKGLDQPVSVIAVRSEEQNAAEAIAPFVRATASPPARRWQRKAVAAGVAFAVLAALVVVPLARRSGGSSAIAPNSIGVLDPKSGELIATIALPARPGSVAASADAVWVTNPDIGTVTRIDPTEQAIVDSIPVGENPTGIAVGFDVVWVVESGGPSVSRISPDTNSVVGDPIRVGNGPVGVAVGEGAVWVTNRFDGTISRIDPHSGKVFKPIQVGLDPRGIAVGFGSVWVGLSGSNTVVRIDPRTNSVTPIVVGNAPGSLAVSADAVWVVNTLGDSVSRISPETNSVETIRVGDGPSGIAVVQGVVWVANEADGTLSRIELGQTPAGIVIESIPQGLAGVNEDLWVSVRGTATSHQGGTLRMLSIEGPRSLDPTVAYDPVSWSMMHLVGDGLVAFVPIGGSEGATLVPDMAISIPTPTDGGRTYTFKLRSGIRYSNGEVVAPLDFRSALERGFRLEKSNAHAALYGGIAGAEACVEEMCDLSRGVLIDDVTGTITFKLLEPDPEFLYKLTLPFAYPVPPSVLDEEDEQVSAGIPGTGPYMVEPPMTREGLALVRNPHFHAWSEPAQPNGYVDRIEWTFGVTPQAQFKAVAAGDADLAFEASSSRSLGEMFIRFAAQVHTSPSAATLFVVLNTATPPFDDVRVRKAMNLAVDRDRVVQILGGVDLPTCQQLPPNFPGYRPYCPYTIDPGPEGEGSWSAPDLEKAKRLVVDSGTGGMPVKYEYTPYFQAPQQARLLGDYMVELLESLGYRPSVEELEVEDFYARGNQFQMALDAWIADYPAASNFITSRLTCDASDASSEPSARSGFCDQDIDEMVDSAIQLQADEPAASGALWAKIDHAIVDHAPYLWLMNPTIVEFVSERVGNYQWSLQWGVLLNQLWVQ